MAGQSIRSLTALLLARAFHEHRPLKDLVDLIPHPRSFGRAA
ncbi:MAG: hypothetical protein ACREQM_17565 [Candidatus Dormibacteraceae bacterium]